MPPTRRPRESRLCPACREGTLVPRQNLRDLEYGGVQEQQLFFSSICDRCGAERIGTVQATINKRVMISFRKRVDGLMDGEEVWAFRKRFALSQKEAAALFGGGKVGFCRYERNDVVQSEGMDTLLRLCAAVPENLRHIARLKGIRLSEETMARLDAKE